jgi:hypothetical protein
MMRTYVLVLWITALGALHCAPGCGRPGHEEGVLEASIRLDFQMAVARIAELRESKVNDQLDWEADGSEIRDAVLGGVRTQGASWMVLVDADWWDDESRPTIEDGAVRLVVSPTANVFEYRDGMFPKVNAKDLASDRKWFMVLVGFAQ